MSTRILSGFAMTTVLSLCFAALSAARVEASVYLNEYRHNLALDSDIIEVHNSGPGDVDLGGWIIRTLGGTDYVFPSGTILLDGDYLAVDIGDQIDPIGGQMILIDDLDSFTGSDESGNRPGNELVIDRVRFGIAGGAPAPPRATGASLARVPDASANPPLIPTDDENWWTIDPTPTIGGPNDAQSSNLGAGPVVNEIRVAHGTGTDWIEVFNPLPSPVNLGDWFASSGHDIWFLEGVVPPLGFAAFAVPGLDLSVTRRVDLFNPLISRLDQKGIDGAPPADCYGLCPDGAPPSNGYNYLTSGGGDTWFPGLCSLGSSNQGSGGDCDVTGIGDEESPDPAVEPSSWGEVKRRFR
ncbi:MAG: lamin tail domain-containing protein [Candidatus Eisenbacteria bacterium]|uniref:Lamin tail domain-containing protein n=1 Tax=Eiseniibacteriota bacterium TaxID=2212470 RepID=A0A956NF50_UNCEI|nr:lamin tail domain-containing protein [Candidatus Eisenbacteria bacterium]